jgi:hypothetical protein
MLLIESLLVVAAVLIGLIYPSLGSRWFDRIEHQLAKLSRRKALSIFLVGASALAFRAAILPSFPIPEPLVHDEFGYLLAADTYAHGRLTNPTHPMWIHFETFSVLQRPTYQCFAQPAQGMILALGRVAFGHPFWGVWLSAGVMCAAITWMLQGWLPPGWALLGGALAVLRYGVITYWADSYWGGAAGAIGGALIAGALPRIKSSHQVRAALVMGLGLAVLANSRPYEGLVFSFPIAISLFAWILGRNRPSYLFSLRQVIVPLTLVMVLLGGSMGYYFWRVTGSPYTMPYQVERQTYGVAPYMLWQHVRPEPVYHHVVMREMFVDEELIGYNDARSSIFETVLKVFWWWRFYLGPLFTFPFLMLLLILPYGFKWNQISSDTRFFLITLGFFGTGVLLETFYSPHYSSPTTGLLLALTLNALRRVSRWHFGPAPTGLFLARMLPVICAVMFAMRVLATPLHIPLSEFYMPAWYQKDVSGFGRAAIQSRLQQLPGSHLVIVRYKPKHQPFAEWVYNDADIDNSKVIWAREMAPMQNLELTNYFKDRKVWLVEPDLSPPGVSPYPLANPELNSPAPQSSADRPEAH